MNSYFFSSFSLVLVFLHTCIATADWGEFQRKHILDPQDNDLGKSYNQFNVADWTHWMSIHADPLERKELTVVLVGTNATILQLFRKMSDLETIVPINITESEYWSKMIFRTFAVQLNRMNVGDSDELSYDVYDCHNVWIGAVIDMLSRPIRMTGFSTLQNNMPQYDTSICKMIGNSAVSIKITIPVLSFAIFITLWTFITSN